MGCQKNKRNFLQKILITSYQKDQYVFFKILFTRNDHTPKPESPVRQARTAFDSNQGVPVNLTCKLTRK